MTVQKTHWWSISVWRASEPAVTALPGAAGPKNKWSSKTLKTPHRCRLTCLTNTLKVSRLYTSAHTSGETVIIPISRSSINTLGQSHPAKTPLSEAVCHPSPGSSLCRFPNGFGKDRLLLNVFSSCFASLQASSVFRSPPPPPKRSLPSPCSLVYSKFPVRLSVYRRCRHKGNSKVQANWILPILSHKAWPRWVSDNTLTGRTSS